MWRSVRPLLQFFLLALLDFMRCGFFKIGNKNWEPFCNLPHYCKMNSETILHTGGCHCRRVRWQIEAPPSVIAVKCNCSICSMRGSVHFTVSSKKFKLMEESEQFLTTYTFGTNTAKHTFCKVCGITSFYVPRGNPDSIAVGWRCIDPGTLVHVEIRNFDGKNNLH